MMKWVDRKRPNANAKIPYAYKASDKDPLILVPDSKIVPFIEEAMTYLDTKLFPKSFRMAY